ncbi:MAG: 4Fe-4S binding protein, partial [Pseudomonadota bacterium]
LTRVERNIKQCENCHLCTQSCPNRVSVSIAKRVGALECTNCGVCVKACPHGALNISLKIFKFKLPFKQIVIAAIILGVFYFVPQLAKTLGYWHSSTPREIYLEIYKDIHHLGHP